MIAIVDYGMGNLASVYKAMLYIGQDAMVTSSVEDLLEADAVILPGVGSMASAMANLKAAGLDDGLYETVRRQRPLLGICLGKIDLHPGGHHGCGYHEYDKQSKNDINKVGDVEFALDAAFAFFENLHGYTTFSVLRSA